VCWGEVLRAVELFLEELSRRIRVKDACLFGSYAKATWIETSNNIDLVIVSPNFRGMPYLKRLDLINEIRWKPSSSIGRSKRGLYH